MLVVLEMERRALSTGGRHHTPAVAHNSSIHIWSSFMYCLPRNKRHGMAHRADAKSTFVEVTQEARTLCVEVLEQYVTEKDNYRTLHNTGG